VMQRLAAQLNIASSMLVVSDSSYISPSRLYLFRRCRTLLMLFLHNTSATAWSCNNSSIHCHRSRKHVIEQLTKMFAAAGFSSRDSDETLCWKC
jgi:hypothetical protein